MSPHYNAGSGSHARQSHHPGTGSRKQKPKDRIPAGRVKVAAEPRQREEAQSKDSRNVPVRLSQKILDTFAIAFPNLLDSSAPGPDSKLTSTLQQVKKHLFDRDFAAAFGSDDFLATYAVRWSASRALAYLTLFDEVFEHMSSDSAKPTGTEGGAIEVKVAAIGGGAGAELLGLAGAHYLRSHNINALDTEVVGENQSPTLHLSLTSLDRAAWTSIHNLLLEAIVTPPVLSRYASAAAKTANHALVSSAEVFKAECLQLDALSSDAIARHQLEGIIRQSSLVTLMFTLNELYSTSLADAQKLLAEITEWTGTHPGALLLVVDSPGSYSEIGVGPQKKKYPMRWLLDLALLGPTEKSSEDSVPWEKLISEESRWFRLTEADQLSYPIDLENMRFQMHLYRRR